MEAEQFIKKNRDMFAEKMTPNMAYEAYDNYILHDILSLACVYTEEIADQETFIFSDGSYITRNQEAYWTGKDIQDFKSLY